MRLPAIEALFPAPWPAAARRVLPSPSPEFTATAMWGPVLAWSLLQLLAESIDADHPEHIALDIFDRLRLREPFAQSFAALGFEGETGWRVAARIKVVLLTGAGIGREELAVSPAEPALAHAKSTSPQSTVSHDVEGASSVSGHDFSRVESASLATGALAPGQGSSVTPASADQPTHPILVPALWSDPDVRWLTGAHKAQGHDYFLRESYEELLWWLHLPLLLRTAADPTLARPSIARITAAIDEALAAAQAAQYRIDTLTAPPASPTSTSSLKEASLDEGTATETESEIQSEAIDPEQPLIDTEQSSQESEPGATEPSDPASEL